MAPKIPYYVVIKGNGYFRPKASMRALGFERVRCGKDGPAAWAIADVWARRWEQAKRGEFVPQRKQMASLKAYPPGSIGEAFHRFRRTAEWAKKAPRTREEWERGWAHLEPLLADVAPGTISLEDMSEVRTAIEARVSWREAHRVIKIWRALWKVAAAMGYCDRDGDPSLGIRNSAPPPRQALWREGEIVRLVKAAWRAGYRGLAAVMATAWDTQLSPVDVRHLFSRQIARNSQGLAFMVSRARQVGQQLERSRTARKRYLMPIWRGSTSNFWKTRRFSEPDLVIPIRRIPSAMTSGTFAQLFSGLPSGARLQTSGVQERWRRRPVVPMWQQYQPKWPIPCRRRMPFTALICRSRSQKSGRRTWQG
jgi:hypothetical protein